MRPQRFGNLILIGMFVAGSYLYFDLHYRYWYHFMEQFGLFLYTNSYFLEFCREPGGINEYLNEALMQFFTCPCCFGLPGFSSRTYNGIRPSVFQKVRIPSFYSLVYTALFPFLDLSARNCSDPVIHANRNPGRSGLYLFSS